jgi:eukaryotic-like serine/threonine-protein kinase
VTIGAAANSYEVLSKLAEGGMAELFLARWSGGAGARRHVVLKRISKSRATDTQYVQMFLNEARLAAQLRHPNIAQVFDIGRLGASYFFTMEYVHGVTVQQLLQTVVDRGIKVPIGAVLAVVAGTAAGLQHAHEQRGANGQSLGIVHRDISPSNLIVSYEGHLKVVDFGVAKAMGRPETQAGEIKGKVGYLSPEQCRMQKIDRRSDLYSLGVVMWEMLTLLRLWQRDTAFGTLAAIATEVPPSVSTMRFDIPPEVDALVRRLLTLDPDDRFQSALEVVDAVEIVAQQTKTSTTPAQLSRLLRELFGSPPEPWLALDAQDVVSVTATPLPPDESLDTFDGDEASMSDVEVKLTSVFRAVTTEDVSATNVLMWRSQPSDETREVPALARATSVGEAPPLTPPPLIVPRADQVITLRPDDPPPRPDLDSDQFVTLRPDDPPPQRPVLDLDQLPPTRPVLDLNELPGSRPLIDAANTIIGAGEPPLRLSARPSFAPAAGSGGRPIPAGALTAPLVAPVPGSGPQPSMPAMPVPGSVPRPSMPAMLERTSGPAMMQLPRFPPPPHGSRATLHWWIIGGTVLGIGLVILVLATRSESNAPRFEDPPIVIVATPPDAAGTSADAAAVIDAPAVEADASAVVDAAVASDATDTEDKKPKTKLRTKPELNAAFRERRYKEIVAACIELRPEGERAVVCTLAACRAHDDAAQEWFRNIVPKQREGTIQICKQSGHPITDVCATDGICSGG